MFGIQERRWKNQETLLYWNVDYSVTCWSKPAWKKDDKEREENVDTKKAQQQGVTTTAGQFRYSNSCWMERRHEDP